VKRIAALSVGVFFLASIPALAGSPESTSAQEPIPAASRGQMECTGFISAAPVPNDIYVKSGADNDFNNRYHAFTDGSYVYLRTEGGSGPTVGQEFRLVRPESDLMFKSWMRAGLGPMPDFGYHNWYAWQGYDIRKLGDPYRDTGRVKVIKLTPYGAVAKVLFACTAVNTGDVALPYSPRPVPTYVPTAHLDRFALLNSKQTGAITALRDNAGAAAAGDIVYLNLGQGVAQPGQKYRIIRVLLPGHTLLVAPSLPDETIGELVVLWVQDKSAVGIIVSALRQVEPGDAIQLE
jgi:hypothetical protein